jgi:glyoxylase-like metal-dependent hydrolase (beta-lactamase superfamily II)
MNKNLKRVLIIIGIIIIVVVLAFVGLFMKLNSEMKDFAPMDTGRVIDNISVVKDDFANIFIIQDSAQYIIIDAGMNSTATAEQFAQLGINPDDVSAVFITHTDSDHAGALSVFKKAKVYLSKAEMPMINGERTKFVRIFGSVVLPDDYILLENRETVQIENLRVEAILAPGHTTGMTAYLVNDKYLFTGDIVSLKDGKIAPIPSFFDMDSEQAVQSHEIIRRIPTAEYIFTAHWGYTDDYQTAVRKNE